MGLVFKDIDKFYDFAKKKNVTAVLFYAPQLRDHALLRPYFEDETLVKFELDKESSETFQCVKVPQIRFYRFGNEQSSTLVGPEIEAWRVRFNGLLNTR